ncbi:Protein tyrosine phosphatase type IVA 3 [Entamoeba marina]
MSKYQPLEGKKIFDSDNVLNIQSNIPFQTIHVSALSNPASIIEFEGLKFFVFDSPTDDNIDKYIMELRRHNVTEVVRCCHPSYDKKKLLNNGINVHELVYQDEGCPSSRIVSSFMKIISAYFYKKENNSNKALGIHCLSGIGRAPTLVAIALIELGMENNDAIKLVRSKRGGAINVLQSRYIRSYTSKQNRYCGCTVM